MTRSLSHGDAVRMSLLLSSLLVATSGFAVESSSTISYAEWRERTPVIDEAVSHMPSQELHDTLSRISTSLSRGAIAGLTSSDFDDLPASYQRSMSGLLADLRSELRAGLPELASLQDQYVILQVVEAVATSRNHELNLQDARTCLEGADDACVNLELDLLARELEPTISGLLAFYDANPHREGPAFVELPTPASVNRGNFSSWVDDVRDSFGLSVPTVPSIDD